VVFVGGTVVVAVLLYNEQLQKEHPWKYKKPEDVRSLYHSPVLYTQWINLKLTIVQQNSLLGRIYLKNAKVNFIRKLNIYKNVDIWYQT
jgi:hypothetical protein